MKSNQLVLFYNNILMIFGENSSKSATMTGQGKQKFLLLFFGADFKCIDLQLLQQGAKKQVIRMHEERNKERVGPQPQIREQMRLGTYL